MSKKDLLRGISYNSSMLLLLLLFNFSLLCLMWLLFNFSFVDELIADDSVLLVDSTLLLMDSAGAALVNSLSGVKSSTLCLLWLLWLLLFIAAVFMYDGSECPLFKLSRWFWYCWSPCSHGIGDSADEVGDVGDTANTRNRKKEQKKTLNITLKHATKSDLFEKNIERLIWINSF